MALTPQAFNSPSSAIVRLHTDRTRTVPASSSAAKHPTRAGTYATTRLQAPGEAPPHPSPLAKPRTAVYSPSSSAQHPAWQRKKAGHGCKDPWRDPGASEWPLASEIFQARRAAVTEDHAPAPTTPPPTTAPPHSPRQHDTALDKGQRTGGDQGGTGRRCQRAQGLAF